MGTQATTRREPEAPKRTGDAFPLGTAVEVARRGEAPLLGTIFAIDSIGVTLTEDAGPVPPFALRRFVPWAQVIEVMEVEA